MPATKKRSTAGGGQSGRRAGARPARRSKRRSSRTLARRISWSRRVGAAGALVLLAGAGIAFASGALDGKRADGSPRPTETPIPAPALLAPDATLVRASTTDLTVILPERLSRDRAFELRVYVNDEVVTERPVLADAEF